VNAKDGSVAEKNLSIRVTAKELREFEWLRGDIGKTRFLKNLIRQASEPPITVTLPSPEAELLRAMAEAACSSESEVAVELIMKVIHEEATRRHLVPVLDEVTGEAGYMDLAGVDVRARAMPREGDQPRAKESASKVSQAPRGVARKRTTKKGSAR
jgi:hypothetical protein